MEAQKPQAVQQDDADARRRRMAESMVNEINKVDMEAERDFIEAVTAEITEPLKKIPEPVFREIFLPYFTGEKRPTEKDPAIAHWVGLVNGPTESAEVVNVKGETLFIVPPIYNSRTINTLRSEKTQPYSAIFTEFADQAMVHKGVATREMAHQLAKKLDGVVAVDEAGNNTASGWQKIHEYYGVGGKTASITNEAPKTAVEDDPDFQW